ncbi:MAG TPA: phenylalanine--tRNA ligase subunit alpha [Candidatus Nanoarchaeia archaeon]|nr:phenylalanine--tRNA ligase subunit alpha [Candidatus Nanoarchaeia archaeon]
MEDIKELISKLHPLERKIVPLLRHASVFSELVKKSELKEVEVMRALQWLQSKEVLKIKEDVKEVLALGDNGKKAVREGLPEKLFLESIKQKAKHLDEIEKETGLSKQELNACIGILKGKAAININAERIISISNHGKALLEKEGLEEGLLKRIANEETDLSSLKDEERFAFESLKKRKEMIKTNLKKEWHLILTEVGKKLVTANLGADKVVEKLTSAMLKSGAWKGKEFRAYDIRAKVPRVVFGKKHFVNEAISYVKKIWLEMGFQEMKGSIVQTAFWDLDALFVPQDHPAREMQDTFFLSKPAKGRIPDKELYKRVKATHENGWTTNSKGWQYKFSDEKAEELLLRTHTTVLSARTIAALKKIDLPAKFFSVGKVFRNEALDWKHLFEFYQVDGIVVDPDANMTHLKGYLREFYKKMGYEKVRIRPSHFPYTEPSAEVEGFHPVKKEWVELGGSGIFRPEVVKPLLGIEIPVLAWGLGLERIITAYYQITDLRDCYKNDLEQLRTIKKWMR